MILWIVKLLSSIRRAVAGRRYPSQLAWAVSFGLLLGVVPHGNLLAIAILIGVLSLRVNHAMAGLTAIGASFLATRLDPYSHQVGDWVLSHPAVQEKAIAAWQLPLVPWTDLNNTVVMGSFLIGTAALCPVFLVAYPLFRLFAPKKKVESETTQTKPSDTRKADEGVHQIVLVDPSHQTVTAPHPRRVEEAPQKPIASAPKATTSQPSAESSEPNPNEFASELEAAMKSEPIAPAEDSKDANEQPTSSETPQQDDVDFVEIDHATSDSTEQVAVETRIDVIRMQDHRDANATNDPEKTESAESTDSTDQPMDEALNYLLRQLRDSQQRKAA